MRAFGFIAEHLLAPALDAFRGTPTMREYAALRESQWWPRDRILKLQSTRLRHLIPYCYTHVPYYRRVMNTGGISPDEIASADALAQLPVTTKEQVRTKPEDFVAQGFPTSQLVPGRTGGSTGTPLEFFSTREARMTHGYARALRAHEWAGIHLGDPIIFVSKSLPPQPGILALISAARRFCERSCWIDAARISDDTLPYAVRTIEHAGGPALIGYASAIYIIASYIHNAGLAPPTIAAVIPGGEQLHDFQREMIRNVFGVEPLSKYSSFENYEIAMECPTHSGMHVAAEDLVVEAVDEEGTPLPNGVNGRILVTDLHNYGMPLIRYDTGDVGAFIKGRCECGRDLPLLSIALAKTGDILYTPSGKRLSPLALGASSIAHLPVREFQFVQERLDHVVIRVVPCQALDSDAAAELRSKVAGTFSPVLGEDVNIEVILTDRIEPTATGKHRFVISNVGPDPLATGRHQ